MREFINVIGGPLVLLLLSTLPIWLSFVLIPRIAEWWIDYKQEKYLLSIDWALLHVRLPKDVHKSPLAMEMVLNALHQTSGTGKWLKRWFQGKVRDYFSLEMVSIEGSIHFFIRTNRKYVDFITASVYSQYPQVEITEVDDYTRYVPQYKEHNEWNMWTAELKLTKDDAYPIKTYIDYGMDKQLNLRDEQQIDPLTPMIELFGMLRQKEQMWIQYIVRADTRRFSKKEQEDWRKQGQQTLLEYLESVGGAERNEKGDLVKGDLRKLTNHEMAIADAIQRGLSKFAFDVGIRTVYLAHKDVFRGSMIAGFVGVLKNFSSPHLNGLTIGTEPDTQNPWEYHDNWDVEPDKEALFNAYVDRGYFYPPYKYFGGYKQIISLTRNERKQMILTTEELATLFHFPGQVSETPTFERIEATKSEPPVNLPM